MEKKRTRNKEFIASFASGIESDRLLVSEYTEINDKGKEQMKMVERFKEVSEEVKAKEERNRKTLQRMVVEKEEKMKEERRLEKQLAEKLNELCDLQASVDGAKESERKAQKILETNTQLMDKNRDLKSELKMMNDQ